MDSSPSSFHNISIPKKEEKAFKILVCRPMIIVILSLDIADCLQKLYRSIDSFNMD